MELKCGDIDRVYLIQVIERKTPTVTAIESQVKVDTVVRYRKTLIKSKETRAEGVTKTERQDIRIYNKRRSSERETEGKGRAWHIMIMHHKPSSVGAQSEAGGRPDARKGW